MRHESFMRRGYVCVALLVAMFGLGDAINLYAAASPYSGTPVSIPGTIEAENFDAGGEGVAYHDTTAGNTGGQYRPSDVDIQAASGGGYNVGWIDAGEWLNYTLNVPTAGNYTVQLRVASPTGASLHVGFNGTSSVWKPVSIPITNGWQNWTTVSVAVTLGAGTQQMTIRADTAGFNIDKAVITSGGSGGSTSSTSTPYSGTPAAIPGTIQAENFDNGGEGVGYHDTTTGNTGGQYRSTDVDIEASNPGGYNVGWIAAGEWLNYTVNVTAAGNYSMQLRVASLNGASMHVRFNGGSVVSAAVSVPATGAWQNWTTVTVPVTLAAGTQLMTLTADTANFNVDSITITSGGSTSPGTTPPVSSAYSGTPAAIPGLIQAENFDNGGEGVGFHDTTAGNTGGQYRSTNVDIEATSGGGYNVGWIDAGEWLKYSVNVSATGSYIAQLRLASPGGASAHLAFSGPSNVSTAVSIPATGGWQNWTTVSVPVTLAAGAQQMTFTADTAGFNIDSVNVVSGATTSAGTVTVTLASPASGTHFVAPATISLTANASTTAGTVTSVQFLNGSTNVGTSTSAPYGGTWSNVAAGTYVLAAKATNSGGVTATSPTVTVTVDSTSTPTTPPPTTVGLVQPGNLVYQGSFRVPHADTLKDANGLGLDYGGTAVGFNPAHNSLFMVGHDWDQRSTEIAIPGTLGAGSAAGGWPMGTALQPMSDALEGHLADVAVNTGDKNTKVGGQFVYNGQLYVTTYVYYGTSEAHVIYRRSPSLTTGGSLIGGMALSPLGPDFYSGYMGLIPPEWQGALGGPVLLGNCCLSIISRTSYGPAVSAVNLANLTPAGATASSPLVYYPSDHTTLGNWGDAGVNLLFNGTTQIKGVVFPTGTSSVLFFGRQGVGPYCYGEGSVCNDPAWGSKGDHAYPYEYYVWAYDAHDLAAVKAGQKQPWEVKPYTVWALSLPNDGDGTGRIGGAAYDPATGRIYVVQMYGDGAYPAVHVFSIH